MNYSSIPSLGFGGDLQSRLVQTYDDLNLLDYSRKLRTCQPDSQCNLTYCQSCSRQRSKKRAAALIDGIESIRSQYPRSKLSFLTLTTTDVPFPSLGDEVSVITDGWRRFKDSALSESYGWSRSIEVSPSEWMEYGSHPHIHAVVATSQRSPVPDVNELSDQWQKAARLCY